MQPRNQDQAFSTRVFSSEDNPPDYTMKHVNSARQQEIWQEVLAGSLEAYGDLFDLYAKQLTAYAYKISLDRALSKDVVQDVFVYIWQHRANLSYEVEVRFYLYSSVKRATVKQLKSKAHSEPLDDNLNSYCCLDDSPETAWVNDETNRLKTYNIEKTLRALSQREREIITLKYFSELKIREIAVLLEIKEQTVSNTLQNALVKLRKHLIYFVAYLVLTLGWRIQKADPDKPGEQNTWLAITTHHME